MSLQTLAGIPDCFVSGDTLLFTESFADFPPATWTATLSIVADVVRGVDATTSGSNHLFTVSKTISGQIPPGTWPYAITVDDGTQRVTAKTGTIRVLPDFAALPEPSIAEKLLASLEDAILRLTAAADDASIDFNGQRVVKADLGMLQRQRTDLQAEVFEEKRAAAALRGTPDQGIINIRFA